MNAKLLLEIDETAILSLIVLGLATVDEDLAYEVAMWPEEKLRKLAQSLRENMLTQCSIGTAQIIVEQNTSASRTDN